MTVVTKERLYSIVLVLLTACWFITDYILIGWGSYYIGDITVSLIKTLILIYALFALFVLVFKKYWKAALFSSISFLCYLYFLNSMIFFSDLLGFKMLGNFAEYTLALIFVLICFGVLIYYRNYKHIFHYLFIILLLLNGYNLAQIFYKLVANKKLFEPISLQETIPINIIHKETPSIYYILMDAYTSPASLAKYFNYQNDTLLDYLKEKKFYIPIESHTSYNETELCLSTIFGLSYIQPTYNLSRTNIIKDQVANRTIENSWWFQFLSANNYTFNNLSIFDMLDYPAEYKADFHIGERFIFFNSFYNQYKRRLQAHKVSNSDVLCRISPYNTTITIKYILDSLCNYDYPNKSFTYIHILSPHFPYIYTEDGTINENILYNKMPACEQYLDQVIFINAIIRQMIDAIMLGSDGNAVIILAGDHGSREILTIDQKSEALTNLFAVYYPDQLYDQYVDTIASVNTFRYILNKYFEYDIKILPDSSVYIHD